MIYYKSALLLPRPLLIFLRMSNVNMIEIVEFQSKCRQIRCKSSKFSRTALFLLCIATKLKSVSYHASIRDPERPEQSVANTANIQSVACTADATLILLRMHTHKCICSQS